MELEHLENALFSGKAYKIDDMASEQFRSKSYWKFMGDCFFLNSPLDCSIHQRRSF